MTRTLRPTPHTPRLVVFGATGMTGSELTRLARSWGLPVRAAVRCREKLATDIGDDKLVEVVRANITDLAAVDRAIQGASMVFVAVGYKGDPGGPVLLPFVQQVVRSMRAHGAQRLVYQASAMNASPATPLPFHLRVIRPITAQLVDTRAIWSDHDAVIQYLTESARDLDWTVTRAGRLTPGPSQGALQVTTQPGGSLRYVDLARFSLHSLMHGTHLHGCPYLRYA